MADVVIDTNVFVAAGFNSKSAAARIFRGVREGRFRLIWNEPTRRETEIIVRRIPRLDWASIADLFQPEAEFAGPVDLEAFTAISDPDDRKFEEFQVLSVQIDREVDPAKRLPLIHQAEAIMEQDPPLLPIAWETIHTVWYSYLKGLRPQGAFGVYDMVREDTFWLDKA